MSRLLVCAAAVCVGAGLACAQAADETEFSPDRIETVLHTLDSPEFAAREEATRELSRAFHGRSEELLAIVKERELSAEQRVRVLQVAKGAFWSGRHGALGISMSSVNEWRGSGLRVQNTIDGFPVHQFRELMTGDVILRIGGSDLTALGGRIGEGLRAEVLSRSPGEQLEIVILRPSQADVRNGVLTETELVEPKQIETTITLGDWAQLKQQGAMQGLGPSLELAWRLKLERAGVSPKGERRVLSTRTPQRTWASSRGTVHIPAMRFFVPADSQKATFMSMEHGRGLPPDAKQKFVASRDTVNPAKILDDAARLEPAEELVGGVEGLPAQMQEQRIELLRLAKEVTQLRRDLQDRQRSAQERELIRARLTRIIAQRDAAETRFNELRAEALGDAGP